MGINSLEKKTTFSIFYSYLYLYYNGTYIILFVLDHFLIK